MTNIETGMTDIVSSDSSLLATPVDEPEINSISFRKSLRFFQEQLVVNSNGTLPNTNPATEKTNRLNMVFDDKLENNETIKKSETTEDNIQSKSCKISSIPTVDTILESVKVLRAIQKSQEQRGSSWFLDEISNPNNPMIDTTHRENEIPCNGSEKIMENSADSLTNNKLNLSETIIENNRAKCGVELGNQMRPENSMDNTCSFWPSSVVPDKETLLSKYETSNENKINFEFLENMQTTYETIHTNGNVTNDREKTSDSNSVFDDRHDDYRCDNTDFIQDSFVISDTAKHDSVMNSNQHHLNAVDMHGENYFQESDTHLSLNIENETAKIYNVSNGNASDKNSHENFEHLDDFIMEGTNFGKDEVTNRSPDCDSGIGTDKSISISSSSPTHNKHFGMDSWSDTSSSRYVSAECSPCPSLNGTLDISPGIQEFPAKPDEQKTEFSNEYDNSESSSSKDGSFIDNTCVESVSPVTTRNNFSDETKGVCDGDLKSGVEKCSSGIPKYVYSETSPVQSGYNETALENASILQNAEAKDIPIKNDNKFLFSDIHANEHPDKEIVFKIEAGSNNPLECSSTSELYDANAEIGEVECLACDVLEQSKDVNVNSCDSSTDIIPEKDNSGNRLLLETVSKMEADVPSEDTQELQNRGDGCQTELPSTEYENGKTNEDVTEETSGNLTTEHFSSEQIAISTDDQEHKQLTEEKQSSCEEVLEISDSTNESKETVFGGQQMDTESEIPSCVASNDEDDSEELRRVKYTASSLNLISILELLYKIPDIPISEIFQNAETTFKKSIFVLSSGAFTEYDEGYYSVSVENSFISIAQEVEILKMYLKYAQIYAMDNNVLAVDNKMGRIIYLKFDNEEELKECKEILELNSLIHWKSECMELVHYPLKCHQNVVIIDLGSCSTRAGILMDQPTLPSIFFPTVCASDKLTGKKIYGVEALLPEVRHSSHLSFPVRPSPKIKKYTMDVESLGGLFRKVFSDLRVNPNEYTVQVCLSRSLSIATQDALTKLLLEDIGVKAVSLTCQALLTLYAHNIQTGVVVDVGDRMDIVPVVNGFIVERGITRLPYGGQRIIHHMKHALAEKHLGLSNDIDSFVVQYIIENLTYIAPDYKEEVSVTSKFPHKLRKTITLQPFAHEAVQNMWTITLDEARFTVPEGLFDPDLWGLDNPGIHQLVQKAIQASGVDVRKTMAENIVVSGGVTMTPGFVERLSKEVSDLNSKRFTPQVIASNYRYHCTYIGACKFSRLQEFPRVCVNNEEYRKNSNLSLKKFLLSY